MPDGASLTWILFGIYTPLCILGMFCTCMEQFRKRLGRDKFKTIFYSMYLLQVISRMIMVLWASIQEDSEVHSIEMLYDIPSLIFLSVCTVIILQIAYVYLPDGFSSSTVMSLLFLNAALYIVAIVCFALVDTDSGEAKAFPILSTFMASFCFVLMVLLSAWCYVIYVGRTTMRLTSNSMMACCLFFATFLVVRLVLLGVAWVWQTPNLKYTALSMHDAFHIEAEGYTLSISLLMCYYIFGEVLPSFFLLVIQVKLGDARILANASETDPLTRGAAIVVTTSSKHIAPLYEQPPVNDVLRGPRNNVGKKPESTGFSRYWDHKNVLLHEVLGRGGSGAVVYRCSLREGPFAGGTFAVKVMKDCVPADMDALLKEIIVYQNLNHPNILRYVGCALSARELRLFMEFVPLTLEGYHKLRLDTVPAPRYFTGIQIARYMLQIAEGLNNIHERKICHRDLKSGNVFVILDELGEISHVKIGDFDISKILDTRDSVGYHTANRGTEKFRAPEMTSKSGESVQYDFKVDIWSFGLLIISMATLSEPYTDQNRSNIGWEQRPVVNIPPQLARDGVFQKLKSLYEDCTQPDPKLRPDTLHLISRLQRIIS